MIVWGTRTPVYLLVMEALYPTKLIRLMGYSNYTIIKLILQEKNVVLAMSQEGLT